MEIAGRDGELVGKADVDVVRLSVAVAVASDLAAVGAHAGPAATEDAVLVVEESAVAQDRVAALGGDARAVLVRHLGIAELDVVHRDVGPADDPDRLAPSVL